MDKKIFSEQTQVISELNNMINKGRVPHALIFSGDKSVSKLEVAKLFIKMLYAKYFNIKMEDYNLSFQIDNETHPNIRFVRRDDKSSISINYAREIVNDSSLYSLVEGPMVYVFVDADYFNTNSINSILKFVEEPKDNTYIIFLTENISNIIPTIVSRSIVINFKPLDKYAIYNELLDLGYDKEYSCVLKEYNQDIEKLKEIIDNKSYTEVYHFVLDLANEPFLKKGSLILCLEERIDLLKNNDLLDFFISLLVMLIEDLLKLKRKNNNLTFYNIESRLKELEILYSETKLISYIKDLLELKSYTLNRRQVNYELFLSNLFLDIELTGRGA